MDWTAKNVFVNTELSWWLLGTLFAINIGPTLPKTVTLSYHLSNWSNWESNPEPLGLEMLNVINGTSSITSAERSGQYWGTLHNIVSQDCRRLWAKYIYTTIFKMGWIACHQPWSRQMSLTTGVQLRISVAGYQVQTILVLVNRRHGNGWYATCRRCILNERNRSKFANQRNLCKFLLGN
jgi:hypothetical protein